ncbi:MAG: ErpK protein [Lachnospiraceae bacterium]|nr:ErpK protein [Lachnospiraceae bacterium]
MARPRKDGNTNIDEQITKQEEAVAKAKARYDTEVTKLKDLYAKKDEIKKKELLKAVENSERSYEEIMVFLGGQAK